YSADEWGYFDPNQTLKPRNLLEAGARQMEYDPRRDWDGDLRLCHGVCTGFEKKFNDGLDNIKNFLAHNPNSVVFLKLEMKEGLFITGEKLENKLGDYIYKPRPGRIPPGNSCPGRHGIEPEFLTKAEILGEGKNVIVFAGNGALEDCPGSSRFMEWVHVGLEYEDTGWQKKFDRPDNPAESGAFYDQGRMTLIHDPNTFNSINGGFSDGVFTRGNVGAYMENGHNVFELYNFNGIDTLFHEDVKAKHMVWSWLEDQPSGDGDCGIANGWLGGFDDVPCNYDLKYACYGDVTDTWYVTSQKGHWDGGQQACVAQFGAGVDFAVPTNPRQMKDLLDTTTEWVYVNYHDQSVEGVWQANTAPKNVRKQAYVGDIHIGNPIDQRYMIDRRLYTGSYTEVTAARIRAKDRIKGIELTFSDGAVRRDGTFSVTNLQSTLFTPWAEHPSARLLSGDFDGDGKGDLAVTGGPGWSTVPVSSKSSTSVFFDFANDAVVRFAEWTAASGAKVTAGDFDGDGKTDLAVTGIRGWPSIGVAFSKQ
ncbi:MAG: hypothetical protein AAGF23_14790, partial [Acidobacteriota bacterium]